MKLKKIIFPICFLIFIALSYFLKFDSGKKIGFDFYKFFKSMLSFLPAVFILIGIFEVWIKKEKIERHLGKNSNHFSYLWAILLSGTTVGGLYVAFPIAHSLYKKGAKLSIIFTYIGSAAVARVPMSIYEASYVGLKFTVVRIICSLPLIILSSIFLEKYLKKKNYSINNVDK